MNVTKLTDWVKAEIKELADTAIGTAHQPSESDYVQRATKGSEARAFLESRLVQEFVATAEARLMDELVRLPLGDDDGRKRLAVAIQTQRQLWKWLGRLASEGAAAEKELERLRSGKRSFF